MSNLRGIVFIVGASRSGTTMLNRILGQHPSVAVMKELHYFGDLFKFGKNQGVINDSELIKITAKIFARYRRGLWNDFVQNTDIESAGTLLVNAHKTIEGTELFHRFIEYVADETGSYLVAEQTPRNIYYAADILDAYPNARIVHIIRDPRAVIASQKKRWTRRKTLNAKNIPIREMIREKISYHPYTMILLWKKAFVKGQDIQGSDRYLRIKFEELVEYPIQVVRQLCDFLEIPFDKKMLAIQQVDSSLRVADNTSVGIQKSAVDAWKKVLSSGETFLIEKELSLEIKQLGYKKQSLPLSSSRVFFSLLLIFLSFPTHLLASLVINPHRFFIQLTAVLIPGFKKSVRPT
ncbi:MAG: sulfotransferase [Candidatus Electrothrix scaldis]|nr:MAG: sulfotransferase [Candidatus Electrothrix sp. GW3-3]